ncbi:ComF family protein, partial [bacterium]|nr:ComF family protein [bacterium]
PDGRPAAPAPVRSPHRHDRALARRDELAGVFSVPPGIIRPGDRVLVVDDIVTSGATVQEVARYLKQQGAMRVDVMAVAMTPKGYHE